MDNVCSLPPKRYFSRQSFPPEGVTSRNKPRSSEILNGVAPGLADLIDSSDRAVWGYAFQFPLVYPQQDPQNLGMWADEPGCLRAEGGLSSRFKRCFEGAVDVDGRICGAPGRTRTDTPLGTAF